MSLLDATAIAAYLAATLFVGLWTARGHGGADDLLLGGRKLPGWAVLCSLVATELSAATFVGVPHAAYTGDWTYLQLAFGALLGKLVIAVRVIPRYHALRVVTVYGFLEERFGPRARRASALCFAVGRTGASGARLFIAALAFAAASGLPVETAIVLCGLVAAVYTLVGGIRSVVWTDALQAAVFVAGASAIVGSLLLAHGGVSGILAWAEPDGRTTIFQLEPLFSWSQGRAFGAALAGGFFLTLATHTTDHDMVQRLLTTRTAGSAARALAGSALLNFPLTALFLFIGTGLALHTGSGIDWSVEDPAQIVPLFALHELPDGLRGLLFAGLFAAAMSSLDSAVCAIASTWVVDVAPRTDGPAELARRTRRASAGAALALIAAAVAMASYHRAVVEPGAGGPNLVEFALSSMTIVYGGMLGVFGLGLFTRLRVGDTAAVAGLATGAAVGLALFLHPVWTGAAVVAWVWWVPLAAAAAAAVSLLGPRGRS